MKMHEMTKAIANLYDDESLSDDAIKDTIESIDGDFQDKGVNIVKLTSEWDADVKKIDDEIKRLQAKKKAIVSRGEHLKEYLKTNMSASGISKIESPLFTITLKKPRKIVCIENGELLPDEYVSVITTVKPNKTEIAKALKEGVDVPGAVLVDSEYGLMIK